MSCCFYGYAAEKKSKELCPYYKQALAFVQNGKFEDSLAYFKGSCQAKKYKFKQNKCLRIDYAYAVGKTLQSVPVTMQKNVIIERIKLVKNLMEKWEEKDLPILKKEVGKKYHIITSEEAEKRRNDVWNMLFNKNMWHLLFNIEECEDVKLLKKYKIKFLALRDKAEAKNQAIPCKCAIFFANMAHYKREKNDLILQSNEAKINQSLSEIQEGLTILLSIYATEMLAELEQNPEE